MKVSRNVRSIVLFCVVLGSSVAAHPADRILVCLGDSNTEAGGSGAWCERLSAKIEPHHWVVSNYAFSGALAQDGELGIYRQWRAVDRDRLNPDLVIVMIGANDVIWHGATPDSVAGDIFRFRKRLNEKGIAVWLAPYHVIYSSQTGLPRKTAPAIREINRLLKLETDDREWIAGFDSEIRWPEDYRDGIHSNASAGKKRAHLVFEKMNRQGLLSSDAALATPRSSAPSAPETPK